MSILNNNKKGNSKGAGKNAKNTAGNSKFIKSSPKGPAVPKQVRSTGGNRGS